MTALFVALGIAIITLLFILLWYVPHLLQQQAARSEQESSQLRLMLLDMLNEQEAVMQRQSQLSAAMTNLQQQLTQLTATPPQRAGGEIDMTAVRQLEERITALQQQIQRWIEARGQQQRQHEVNDNEAWANLLSLLAAIQERIAHLSTERTAVSAGLQARALLEELEQEMAHLRSISEDIATLQWRLRRSLHERETSVAQLRARAVNSSSTARPA
ncbi:hypothetical protein [uncultured Chloroflexus sp.]|uniref:hypothetical protein n=1 Tax=uncultured Chloroflexus sp. TaxID=214040 RepID=UPI00260D5E7C|nr:hypothetical protein [uncultured Chloroflexus sp.]